MVYLANFSGHSLVVCNSLSSLLPTGEITYSDPLLGVGNMATITCNMGYVINGSSTLTCKNDSNWDSSIPNCVGKIH